METILFLIVVLLVCEVIFMIKTIFDKVEKKEVLMITLTAISALLSSMAAILAWNSPELIKNTPNFDLLVISLATAASLYLFLSALYVYLFKNK